VIDMGNYGEIPNFGSRFLELIGGRLGGRAGSCEAPRMPLQCPPSGAIPRAAAN